MEFNFTYAPSKTGKKETWPANEIPFQDKLHGVRGNLVLWYQDKRFEVRLAYNYRSKRGFFRISVGGIAGFGRVRGVSEVPRRICCIQVSASTPQVFVDANQPDQRVPAVFTLYGPISRGTRTSPNAMFHRRHPRGSGDRL